MRKATFTSTDTRHRARGHRRFRPAATLAVGGALLLALPVTAAASPSSARQLERLAVEGVEFDPRVEPLRLDCAAALHGDTAAVRCQWSVPTSDAVAGVRLLRIAVGADTPRETVFRTEDISVHSFADASVRPGARYAYAAQGLNAAGRVVASSRTVHVGVPPLDTTDVEALRLRCVPALAGGGEAVRDARSHVGCEWSLPSHAQPRLITLWRSVDGAERERVASFATPFATSYRDAVPARTSRVVYAVIGTDGDGEIVARSRAVGVTFPTPDRPQRPTVPDTVAPTTATDVAPDRAVDRAVDIPAQPQPRPTHTTPASTTSVPMTSVPTTTALATVRPKTTVLPATRPTPAADADADSEPLTSSTETERERSRRGGDG